MPRDTIEKVLKQVDETIVSAMNKHALPGLAAGIIHADEVIYAKGFGVADAARERAVTADTVFRIGSISKTFTAIGVMQLWEQGAFKLDDPVNSYLKRIRIQHRDPNAPPVTIRHMLTHTSGIGSLRSLADALKPQFGLGAEPDRSLPALNTYYAEGLHPDVYPETKWAYANHAFAVLGQLVEDVSGQPFPEYMIQHVFEPLGMTHTDYLRSERVRDELAVGYALKRGGLKPVKYQEIIISGAGSIFSSLNDMSKYVVGLLNGGRNACGAFLKPETLKLMMEPHYQPDERLPGMGLAFVLDNFDGHHIVWHNGGWPGFSSAMWTAPDAGLGVLLFSNTICPALDPIAMDLLRRMLDVPDPVSQLPRPDLLETPHHWSDLCGFYGPQKGFNTNVRPWMNFAGEVEVFVRDNRLAVRTLVGPLRKGIALYRYDADDPFAFRAALGERAQTVIFKKDITGRVNRVHIGLYAFYKRPRTQSLRFRVMAGLGALVGLGLALAGRRKYKSTLLN
jgi:CubicO group peptidase (beta-lactamase class C family)